MQIKVHGGTTKDGKRLCDSCTHAFIARGLNNEELVKCCMGMDQVVIPFKVIDCNRYQNRNHPSLYDMGETAWILRTDRSGLKIGFVSGQKFRKENPDEDVLPAGC